MNTMADIMTWAKLKGDIDYAPSQAGSLLTAVGAESDTTIEEFAAIPEETFLSVIRDVWTYAASNAPDDALDTDANIKPSAIKQGQAAVSYTHLTLPTKRIV